MFCCITDNLESQSGIVKVGTVRIEMFEVVLNCFEVKFYLPGKDFPIRICDSIDVLLSSAAYSYIANKSKSKNKTKTSSSNLYCGNR